MALAIDAYMAKRPVDADLVETHKRRMLAEARAYRLRELRERAGLTQAELASRIGVGQRQVSKIEQGDIENTKVGTSGATSRPSVAASPSSMCSAIVGCWWPEAR